MLPSILILGYGNPDRQDDGVAWHILSRIACRLGRSAPASLEEGSFYPEGDYPHLYFLLQLTPEISETASAYDRICFVDAHTGRVPDEISLVTLEPEFQSSPFTHHLTPQSCLSLAKSIYGRVPADAILISVRGYDFGFEPALTEKTSLLADQAVEKILNWINS